MGKKQGRQHQDGERSQPNSRKTPEASTSPRPAANVEFVEWTLRDVTPKMILIASVLVGVFAWSYWPTLVELFRAWKKEPDYSHGFLVVPLALYALWLRQDTFPRDRIHVSWWGVVPLLLSILVRYFGARFYVDAVDGWSILLWVAGACWMLGGWRFFRWSLPGVALLIFMIPLPYAVEHGLKSPLQRVATKASCVALQCLGQPALAERNIIVMGPHKLEVEEACSGLRIFVTIVVLAFAYIVIVRPVWWEKLVLILSIVPIALASNAARIVITGMMYQYVVSGQKGKEFAHDFAGWLMIPMAAGLFWFVLWYMNSVFKEVTLTPALSGHRRQPA